MAYVVTHRVATRRYYLGKGDLVPTGLKLTNQLNAVFFKGQGLVIKTMKTRDVLLLA